MQFLSVASHVCAPASFAQALAVLHLPSASGYHELTVNESMSALPQGTSTPLHRAHAGRTHYAQPDLREKPRRPVSSTFGLINHAPQAHQSLFYFLSGAEHDKHETQKDRKDC